MNNNEIFDVAAALAQIFYLLHVQDDSQPVCTRNLCDKFGWCQQQLSVQHDFQEFMVLLFSLLEENNLNHLTDPWNGHVTNHVRSVCRKYDYSPKKEDPFQTLKLYSDCESVVEGLKNYSTPMMLTGPELYLHPQFGKIPAERHYNISKIGEIWMIQLGTVQDKNECKFTDSLHTIQFSDDLNQTKYNLYAVIVHRGTARSGHYWCYINTTCKPGDGSKWIKCNDNMVTPVSYREAINNQYSKLKNDDNSRAYCLIYIQDDAVSNMFSTTPEIYKNNLVQNEFTQFLQDINEHIQRICLNKRHFTFQVSVWNYHKIDIYNKYKQRDAPNMDLNHMDQQKVFGECHMMDLKEIPYGLKPVTLPKNFKLKRFYEKLLTNLGWQNLLLYINGHLYGSDVDDNLLLYNVMSTNKCDTIWCLNLDEVCKLPPKVDIKSSILLQNRIWLPNNKIIVLPLLLAAPNIFEVLVKTWVSNQTKSSVSCQTLSVDEIIRIKSDPFKSGDIVVWQKITSTPKFDVYYDQFISLIINWQHDCEQLKEHLNKLRNSPLKEMCKISKFQVNKNWTWNELKIKIIKWLGIKSSDGTNMCLDMGAFKEIQMSEPISNMAGNNSNVNLKFESFDESDDNLVVCNFDGYDLKIVRKNSTKDMLQEFCNKLKCARFSLYSKPINALIDKLFPSKLVQPDHLILMNHDVFAGKLTNKLSSQSSFCIISLLSMQEIWIIESNKTDSAILSHFRDSYPSIINITRNNETDEIQTQYTDSHHNTNCLFVWINIQSKFCRVPFNRKYNLKNFMEYNGIRNCSKIWINYQEINMDNLILYDLASINVKECVIKFEVSYETLCLQK